MRLRKVYTDEFYESISPGSLKSARVIVPIIIDLIKPKSVVDVGCGRGEFLSVFRENGIEDILGIDGEHVNRSKLMIPKERFLAVDLEKPDNIKKFLNKLNRKFDLVVSLEVAEHLSKDHAEMFVKMLTELGPIVLFSAAIPFQGGVRHVNEQWPDYWCKIFAKFNYLPLDIIRWKIWENEEVEVQYRQNIILFIEQNYLKQNKLLSELYENFGGKVFRVVHPEIYISKILESNIINKFKYKLKNIKN